MTRLVVFGFRGFPNVEGGIETHAENLYPLLAEKLSDIRVVARAGHVASKKNYVYKNVLVVPLRAFSIPALENISHSIIALMYAIYVRADIVHIHGIGPALLTPLARLFGIKVLVTHHGKDYDSEKWNAVQKAALKLGEWVGMKCSNRRIAVSAHLRRHIESRFAVSASHIPNGVNISTVSSGKDVLKELGLEPGKYIIEVARIAEHKRQDHLIESFLALTGLDDWKLVIVGDYSESDDFARKVVAMADRSDRIIMAGYRTGAGLSQIYENAGLFCLPSSYEGMPLAVLEAMSYGIPVVLSDIPAHQELGLDQAHYHKLGDVADLADRLSAQMIKDNDLAYKKMKAVAIKYDWREIASQTTSVIDDLLPK